MTNNKRSFFEKLTGAVKLEEEMEEQNIPTNYTDPEERKIWEEDEEGQLTVDVYQTPSDIIIKTMVAGVRPEDLDVAITRDTVTIRGKREDDRSVETDDYFHQELYWGSFSRTIILPQEVEVEECEAVEKYGLLIIRLPKIDKNKQTKLKVKGS